MRIMWLPVFVCAFLCASVSAELNESAEFHVFRKCCPNEQSLIKVSDFDNSEERYECLDRQTSENNYNVSHSSLVIGVNVPVKYGKPEQCEKLVMSQMTVAEIEVTPNDQCYDRLVLEVTNGTLKSNIPKIVALTCYSNKTENTSNPSSPSLIKIDHIKKCCPKGQSYDTMYHLCRSSSLENSEEWLVKRLNLSNVNVYEVDNGLHCKADEYGVELSDEQYSLEVKGSSLAVSKSDGDSKLLPQGDWCIDHKYAGKGLMARVCNRDCSGYDAFCVRKCCPVGEHYQTLRCGGPASICVPNEQEVLFDITMYMDRLKSDFSDIPDMVGIRSDLLCPDGKVVLSRNAETDVHYLTRDGFLHSSISDKGDYCFEAFDSSQCPGGEISVTVATCFVKPPITKDFRISFVLITISNVCLALTLVVYCALPELRNLHGRTLICHVSMMLLAFSCLARVQYTQVPDSRICTMLGYGIYFGFVAAFAWLNVMCVDIWWTFGSVRTVQPLRKAGAERRRFLWYSLYAWSFAITLTVTMFLLDKYPIARFLDANIGNGMCWFGSIQNTQMDWPHYIFFVIPMGLVTCTNFILWVLTARHCARVKSEVHRLQAGSVGDRAKRRFRLDRAKYVLTGKLWVVMGAGWISELLSTLASEPQWLWTIIDLINELQGVFIFLILVFKPKLYYLIRKRLGLEKPDAQKNGASSSGRTSSTFLSRTISSDERTNLRISQLNNVKQP